MCGILYGKRSDNFPVAKSLLKRYDKQRNRGIQGFGYISIKDGVVTDVVRTLTEFEMERKLKDEVSDEILLHHRYPTSTPNIIEATHPIVVKNDILEHDYYVIHNGVLTNDDDLKKTHESMGFVYGSIIENIEITKIGGKITKKETTIKYNDSEAFAIELALYLDKVKDSIDIIGGSAFICLETDKDGRILKIHYGRNAGKPLVIEDNNSIFFIKSDGAGKDVPENVIITKDYLSGIITENDVYIGRLFRAGFGTYDELSNTTDTKNVQRHLPAPVKPSEDDIYYDDTDINSLYESQFVSEDRYYELFEESEDLKEEIEAEEILYIRACDDKNSSDVLEHKLTLMEMKEQLRKIEDEMEWISDAIRAMEENGGLDDMGNIVSK